MKTTKVIAVGDSDQSIYGWRGADTDAMEKVQKIFNCKRMPLSICYRCGDAIIAEAQKLVPEIEGTGKEAYIFDINEKNLKHAVQEGDMVLCRLIAPLIAPALRLFNSG